MKINKISILGGADWKPEEKTYIETVETCKLLAEAGYLIQNGGGPGVMRASTEGAHLGHGKAIGITYYPTHIHENFEGKDPSNNFDEEIVTHNYFDRTKVLLETGDVHVLFKGGTGTISEFGMTWASSRIHKGHNKPIILYGAEWADIIDAFSKHMFMRPDEFSLYTIVTTPQEVLNYIKNLDEKA